MADRTIEWGDPPSYATGDGGEDAPDGNFVVAQVPGGGTKLLEYDDSAGAWQMRGDVNHNGNDITNVGALSTEDASIGTVSGEGDVFRLIDRRTPSTNTGEIQFSGLSADTEYKIFYSTQSQSSNTAFLRINGDGSATGNYGYWDASGTEQTGENEWLIVDFSTTAQIAGNIHVLSARFGGAVPGFNHDPIPARPGNINDYGQAGGYDTFASLSSIEFVAEDEFDGGETVVELWERDYS